MKIRFCESLLLASFLLVALVPFVCAADDIFLNESFVADYIALDIAAKYKLFFWLFPSRDNNPDAPLVVFLSGGPGTSCQESALNESGPFRISSNLSLAKNEYSFTARADVLYIDQPLGTGFSTSPDASRIPSSQDGIAEDLAAFFKGFYGKYPKYTNRRVFFAGQDFAGHYIPSAVPYLIKNLPSMKIKGVSIGGPTTGFKSYMNNNMYAKYGLEKGLVGTLGYVIAGVQAWVCDLLLGWGLKNSFTVFVCSSAMNTSLAGQSRYDYTTTCKYEPNCYDYTAVSSFLAKKEVLARLNSTDKVWEYTNSTVNSALLSDGLTDYSSGYLYLLEHNVSLTLYYGERDYVCNYLGGLQWLSELGWKYSASQAAQSEVAFSTVGISKAFYLLNYVRVLGAGHYVTLDRPEVSPAIMEDLVGKGVYRYEYGRGIVTVPMGSPERSVKLLVGTGHQVFRVDANE